MTAAAPPPKQKPKGVAHPDDYRMTIGEHLEELRNRLLLGLAGVAVAVIVCIPFAKQLLTFICKPVVTALQYYHLNPQLFTDDPTEAFMAWVTWGLIAAACVAGPWLVYQLWQFIATGLYPKERKAVTRYVPLAIALLLAGLAFVYWIVLPLTMRFFVSFTSSVPLDVAGAHQIATGTSPPTLVQAIAGDPEHPLQYQMWFNTAEGRLKFSMGGEVRNIPFASDSLFAAHFKLGEYLALVLRLLITFGLCFQLPLLVMVLARLGFVRIDQLKAWRRQVYFGMAILAAIVSPGDVVTATLALLVPLLVLYELGIVLARMNLAKEPPATAGPASGQP